LKFENNGGNGDIHPNSERNLWIALIVIVATPFALDFSIHMILRAVKKNRRYDEEIEVEEPQVEKRRHPPLQPHARSPEKSSRPSGGIRRAPKPPLK
jgi:hypothetical protein